MKKHKVKIPKGHEVDRSFTNTTCSGSLTTTVIFKPIKKELPKSWEEYQSNKPYNHNSLTLFPLKKEDANNFFSFYKLIELRDVYNDGWVPDWKDGNQSKHSIMFHTDELVVSENYLLKRPLSFKSDSLAEEFVENFTELITQARPLL